VATDLVCAGLSLSGGPNTRCLVPNMLVSDPRVALETSGVGGDEMEPSPTVVEVISREDDLPPWFDSQS